MRSRSALLRWSGVRMGERVVLHPGSRFVGESSVTFGDDVYVNHDCFFDSSAPITVGSRVSFGDHVALVTSTHDIADHRRRAGARITKPIVVGDGCWLGAGVS